MILETRGAGTPAFAPLHTLTTKQRRLLEVVDAYALATGESCSVSYLARRLNVHHSTVQKHLTVLFHKGWLRTPNAPAALLRGLDSE